MLEILIMKINASYKKWMKKIDKKK